MTDHDGRSALIPEERARLVRPSPKPCPKKGSESSSATSSKEKETLQHRNSVTARRSSVST